MNDQVQGRRSWVGKGGSCLPNTNVGGREYHFAPPIFREFYIFVSPKFVLFTDQVIVMCL